MPCDPINIEEGDVFDRNKHTSHFDTCPKADNHRGNSKPKQEGVLNPYLQKKLEEYVNAVKHGVGFEVLGRQFLESVEKTHKPAEPDLPFNDDVPDDDVPF